MGVVYLAQDPLIGRQVAVKVFRVGFNASDDELHNLTEQGVSGIRFHILTGGARSCDIMDEMEARVSDFGWHLQLQLDGDELPGRVKH